MLLYMIRHGETENNLAKRHSGHSLTSLTEKGTLDAKCAGEKLKGICFDKIYTSALPRTHQTCKLALGEVEFEPLALINEIDVGLCTDRLVADCEAEWGEKYIASKKAFDYTAFSGENPQMVRDRGAAFLKMLEETDFDTVVAFSHGAFMKHLLDLVFKTEIDKNSLYISNGGICIFEYKNNTWRLKNWNI